jgi:pyruvate-formate lyase
MVLDFETALGKGYLALIEEINARILSFKPTTIQTAQKIHFWRAARRALEGALRFCENYAREAERLARLEADPESKAELLELAAVCHRVPALPPRSFREAIQAFWFTYLLGHLEGSHLGYSPGRMDQVLLPYYQMRAEGSFADAVELFEELFVKMTQIEYIASMSWQGLGHGNLFQNCILGGVDGEGKPADNELSIAILRSADQRADDAADLGLKLTTGVSHAFLMKAVECVGTGSGIRRSSIRRHTSGTS